MKSILVKTIGVLVLIFIFVIAFSTTESKFECNGELTKDEKLINPRQKLFVNLTKYRFWVYLWNTSYGTMRVELPNEGFDIYGKLNKIQDIVYINTYQDNMRGMFSVLSNTINVDVSYFGTFKGQCKEFK